MTNKPKVRILRSHDDDEGIEVYVGVKYIGSANHDEHGWAGIEALESTAKKMAGRYGGRWGWGGGCTARQLGGRNNQLNSEE